MNVTQTDAALRQAMGALRRAEAELIRARLGAGRVAAAERTLLQARDRVGSIGVAHQRARLDNMLAGWGR